MSCRILVDHVDDVDIKNDRDFTPLHIASRASRKENVILLLEYGADPNARGRNGTTPLHRAIKASIVQILIQYNADECLTMTKEEEDHQATTKNNKTPVEIPSK